MTKWLKVYQITHGTKWYWVNIITVRQNIKVLFFFQCTLRHTGHTGRRVKYVFPCDHQQSLSYVSVWSAQTQRYRSFWLLRKICAATSKCVCVVIYCCVSILFFNLEKRKREADFLNALREGRQELAFVQSQEEETRWLQRQFQQGFLSVLGQLAQL